MTWRGCTSRSTSSVAHVRRPSCTVIFCTLALAQWTPQERLKLRGSISVPHFVLKIRLPPCQAEPNAVPLTKDKAPNPDPITHQLGPQCQVWPLACLIPRDG